MIFCAAGDPGGSRALLPVILELARRGHSCGILEHGFLGRELPPSLAALRLADSTGFPNGVACYLFGSSSDDILPLAYAREARKRGVPVVHVLDNWSGYAQRLRHDGLSLLEPDIYVVMDEDARRDAIADGVPEKCLRVTGHPGFKELAEIIATRQSNQVKVRQQLDLPLDKTILVFINEPLRQVLGDNVTAPNHYGFTQDRVLELLLERLELSKNEIFLVVLPHPKDNIGALEELWKGVSRGIPGRILRLPRGRDILLAVDGIAGMASILLYDAWLCGLPTLVLQPGVRQNSIRRIALLPNVYHTNTENGMGKAIECWLADASCGIVAPPRPELAYHLQAPARIATLIEKCLVGDHDFRESYNCDYLRTQPQPKA